MNRSAPTSRRWLIAILAIALLVRIAWAIARPADEASLQSLPDQKQYLETARSLLAGQGLRCTDHDQYAYAYRMPGYPLFVAALGGRIQLVRLAQAVIDTSTVLATYLLARRWLVQWAALLAAALIAANPFLIYFSSLILSESLFAALLIWGMVLLAWRPAPVWGGIVLAASTLVRPGTAPLVIILAIAFALLNSREKPPCQDRPSRWRLPVGTTMLLLVALALLPWAARNAHVLGEWTWTTTNTGITAYDGLNPDATGASDQSFRSQMPWLKNMTELQRNDWFTRQAIEFVKEHPHRAAELAAIKIARTWSPLPLSREYAANPLYVAAALLYSLPVMLLAAAGLFAPSASGNPLRAGARLVLLVPALYITVLQAITVGSLRYRMPLESLLAIWAAAGIMLIVARWHTTNTPAAVSD